MCVLCIVSCQSSFVGSADASSIDIEQKDGLIQVSINDQSVLVYHVNTQFPHDSLPSYYKRSGFIHPITTLKGKVITDGFPLGHTHQHGVFSAWTKATFKGETIDFWNQHKEKGTVRHKLIIDIDEARQSFTVELEHLAYVQDDTIVALNEKWTVEVQARDEYFVIDWSSTQSCATRDAVHPEEYSYGGFAFRGAQEWNDHFNEHATWQFVTNESLKKIKANHSRPLWASMFGEVNGSTAGVAIIPHSSNFRYPQYIRVHPTMPYYCFFPAVKERFSIVPGMDYRTKHRIIVFDGELNTDVVENEKNMFLRSSH